MTTFTESCTLHQDKKAHWICPKCENGFCPSCISRRSTGGYKKETKYFCPKCNVQADWVGAGNLIPPFWKRLHNFFTYPIARGPLLFILVCAGLCAVAPFLGILGLPLYVLGWGFSLKYAFEILRTTSRGKLVPPKINMDTLSQNFGQVFQQAIILIVLIMLGGSLLHITGSLPILLLYAVLAVFFWPSIVILQVISGSILRAINPLFFVPLVGRIGWAYGLLYFFLILASIAPAAAFSFIQKAALPPLALEFCKFSIEIYYLFLTYHLMGYVLLQYHLEIGYTVNYEDFEDIHKDEDDDAPVISAEVVQIDLLLQEGKLDEVMSILRGKAKTGGLSDIGLARKYYELLKNKGETQELCAFATYYMKNLLAAGQARESAQVYEDCAARNAEYMPAAALVPQLGEALEDEGNFRSALKLYSGFLRKYPRDGKIGEVCLSAAVLLNERMGAPDKARKLLEAALTRVPESTVRERISNYLKNSLIP